MSKDTAEGAALRLLIADSDAPYRSQLRGQLEANAYEVAAEAQDADTAYIVAKRLRPDAVLLSAELEGVTAFAVAETLQHEGVAPVILFAAAITPQLIREATRIGIYSFLPKPLREVSLMPAIEIARSEWKATLRLNHRLHRLERADAARDVVDCAKKILIAERGMSEPDAYRYLQKKSMDNRRSMREVAEALLIAHSIAQEESYP